MWFWRKREKFTANGCSATTDRHGFALPSKAYGNLKTRFTTLIHYNVIRLWSSLFAGYKCMVTHKQVQGCTIPEPIKSNQTFPLKSLGLFQLKLQTASSSMSVTSSHRIDLYHWVLKGICFQMSSEVDYRAPVLAAAWAEAIVNRPLGLL